MMARANRDRGHRPLRVSLDPFIANPILNLDVGSEEMTGRVAKVLPLGYTADLAPDGQQALQAAD
jgi:hypothetical protein